MHSVALLTASYAKDIERFSLLSESIDTWLTGYTRHYVLVNDEDVPLFERFASDKRVIVPASRYLPKWLWVLPPALQFISKRRVWLSLLSSPVHGWHIQQIRIFPGRGRGTTALDDRVADWWQRASALAPLRFRDIEQGLPADG